ncbi:nucleoporin nup211 [Schizosaccharomyces pombe]|uniref:Nucleoporin nup211 n=1 Tax=Schizosaccharomyces pombe (strain 972 / ATCC 24843) TaxID=284812 RepID=NU211_SCHPO|nr:nucleoporin nup211 [Schizosaccharomyces pombe]O74424.1 RecName: Full=Nucleoporin nup211; AltName: Full=Nuclear pore protein nup211 [Schizosaccharomyces pombe 972h-]CAA19588.1 nucleoporin nup211 [Schizosaccharomyces pombe]|eukprot:NP_588236.1 nucleoporin nup211 [Schizosaccharomyces pombe]
MHDSSWTEADILGVCSFLDIPKTKIDPLLQVDAFTSILIPLISKSKDYESIKNDRIVTEVNYEQQLRNSEKKLLQSNERYDLLEDERKLLENELSQIKEYLREKSSSYDTVLHDCSSLKSVNEALKQAQDQNLKQTAQLQNLLSDKEKEVEKKITIIKDLKDALASSTHQVLELQHTQQEKASLQTNYEFELQKLTQKNSILENNNTWLSRELQGVNDKLLSLHQEASLEKSQLSSQLSDAVLEKDALQRKVSSLSQQFTESNLRYQNIVAELSEMRKQYEFSQVSFEKEISSQKQISELWMEKCEDCSLRLKELQNSNGELEKLLEAAQSSFEEQLESHKEAEASLKSQINFLEKEVSSLESQLKLANERLRHYDEIEISDMSELKYSNLLNNSMKGFKGQSSVSDLYSERLYYKQKYEQTCQEVERLQRSYNHVMEEANLQHPLVKEQFKRFAHMQREIVAMSEQYQKSLEDCQKAKSRYEQLETLFKDKCTENKHYEQETKDLARQVQVLLHELDLCENGIVLGVDSRKKINSYVEKSLTEDETDTDQIISSRLVVFRNIRELQQQNQNLLSAVHELADRMEKDEKPDLDGAEIQEETLIKANETIDQLTKMLEEVSDQLRYSLKERDFFRSLVQENEKLLDMAPATPNSKLNTNLIEQTSYQRSLIRLEQLTNELESLKSISRNKEKKFEEAISSLQLEKSNIQLQLTSLTSERSLALEKLNDLEKSLVLSERSKDELDESYKSLQEQLASKKIEVQNVSSQLSICNSQLEQSNHIVDNLKSENLLLTSVKDKLKADLSNLESKLSSLQQDNFHMKAQIESSNQEYTATVDSMNSRILELSNDLRVANSKLSECSDDVRRLTLQNSFDLREHQTLVLQLQSNITELKQDITLQRTVRNQLEIQTTELKERLKFMEERQENLQSKLIAANKDTTQNPDNVEVEAISIELERTKEKLRMAELEKSNIQQKYLASEKTLEMMNETHEQFKHLVESEISTREEKITSLRSELLDLNKRVEVLKEEKESSSKELAKQLEDAVREKDSALSFKKDYEKIRSDADRVITSLKEDIEKERSLMKECHSNYESEIVSHGRTTQKLRDLRTEFDEVNTKYLKLKANFEQQHSGLSGAEKDWNIQRKAMEDEISSLKDYILGLENQNKLLHSQFDSLSQQITVLQQNSSENLNISANLEAVQDNDLRELVSYLRHEKEIMDNKYELTILDNRGLNQQVKSLQSTVDSLQLELNRLQSLPVSNDQTDTPIISGSQEVQLLYESNSVLRKDNDAKLGKIQELEKEVEKLNASLNPLQTEINELKAEIGAKTASLNLMKEYNSRWKLRFQSVLNKYERVDPTQLEELKKNCEALEKEKQELETKLQETAKETDTFKQQVNSLNEEVENLKKEVEQANTKNTRLAAAWNEKCENLKKSSLTRFAHLKQELTNKNKELTSKNAENEAMQKEIESLKDSNHQLQESASSDAEQITKEQFEQLKSEKERTEKELADSKNELEHLQSEAVDADGKTEISNLEKEIHELRSDKEGLVQQVQNLSAELAALREHSPTQGSLENADEIARLRSQLESTKQYYEKEKETEILAARSELVAEKEKTKEELENQLNEKSQRIKELEEQAQKNSSENTHDNIDDMIKQQVEEKLKENSANFDVKLKKVVAETEFRSKAKISVYEKKTRDLQNKITQLEETIENLNKQLSNPEKTDESTSSVTETKPVTSKPTASKADVGQNATEASSAKREPSGKSLSARLQGTGKQKGVQRPAVSRPVPMKPDSGKLSITGASKRIATSKNAAQNAKELSSTAKSGSLKRQRDDANKGGSSSNQKKAK